MLGRKNIVIRTDEDMLETSFWKAVPYTVTFL